MQGGCPLLSRKRWAAPLAAPLQHTPPHYLPRPARCAAPLTPPRYLPRPARCPASCPTSPRPGPLQVNVSCRDVNASVCGGGRCIFKKHTVAVMAPLNRSFYSQAISSPARSKTIFKQHKV